MSHFTDCLCFLFVNYSVWACPKIAHYLIQHTYVFPVLKCWNIFSASLSMMIYFKNPTVSFVIVNKVSRPQSHSQGLTPSDHTAVYSSHPRRFLWILYSAICFLAPWASCSKISFSFKRKKKTFPFSQISIHNSATFLGFPSTCNFSFIWWLLDCSCNHLQVCAISLLKNIYPWSTLTHIKFSTWSMFTVINDYGQHNTVEGQIIPNSYIFWRNRWRFTCKHSCCHSQKWILVTSIFF